MNNIDYIKLMLKKNDIILIDTSSIMDYEGFKKLVCQIESPLIEVNKKITVPKIVWTELIKHLNSFNEEKINRAKQAIEIITEHRNIFILEDDGLYYEKTAKTFADAELLSELMKNKVLFNQLLITNDKKLSQDAFNLNNQESFKGRRIHVCFITSSGNLKTCECSNFSKTNKNLVGRKENIVVRSSLPEKGESNFSKTAINIAAFVTGILIGKNYNRLLTLLKIGL